MHGLVIGGDPRIAGMIRVISVKLTVQLRHADRPLLAVLRFQESFIADAQTNRDHEKSQQPDQMPNAEETRRGRGFRDASLLGLGAKQPPDL